MPPVRYADLVFQPDLRVAQRDDGTTLTLSRRERALILLLTEQPHRLVTRSQLLGGLGDLAQDLSERNIDYLINRLRKRLGDDARTPRFIVTQYGEGYVWIADPVPVEALPAFLLLGPVYGLSGDGDALAVVERLTARIGAALGPGRTVRCLPQWRFGSGEAGDIAHSLEVTLLPEGAEWHLALVLRHGRSHAPIAPFRLTVPRTPADGELDRFAQTVVQTIWAHAALPDGSPAHPTDPPLALRLHDAARLITGDIASGRHNAPRLAQAHAADPDNPVLAVLLALNHHAQLIQAPLSPGEPLSDTQWQAMEDEIETLAIGALDRAQGDPMLLLGIAKALCFLNRGHLPLAARLADEAFRTGTAFAAAFAMKAVTAACQGDIDQALDLYARAIELCEAGSEFHLYLLILKGSALLAADRRGEVAQLVAELTVLGPAIDPRVALLFLSPRARRTPPALRSVPLEAGQRMLTYLHRTTARQFVRRPHRRNILHGLAVHLARVHGPAVIPVHLRSYFPAIIRHTL